MKHIPQIDPRGDADLLRAILQKALTYTPEWRFEPDAMDGGGAIATLFADMFSETVDRLNRMPYKYFLEFLNLLDVSVKSITPATGMAQFQLALGTEKHVLIPKNTSLFCDIKSSDPSQESRILFETLSDFHAVPAKIMEIINVNPQSDRIEKVNLEEQSAVFFNPSADKNIQRHFFAIADDNVFSLRSPAEILIKLENSSLKYRNEEFTARLADDKFTLWTYFDGDTNRPFSSRFVKDGLLHLVKENNDQICARELVTKNDSNKRIWITCDMNISAYSDNIAMDSISVGSCYLYPDRKGLHIEPDTVYSNDIPINSGGGYCFGSNLNIYDCLYISSDEVFSKRGSRVNLEFQLGTIIREVGGTPQGPIYDFKGKYIVEKVPQQPPVRDNIFVSRLIWEYWNGIGWRNLKVEGDQNPFDGRKNQGVRGVSFICPDDVQKSNQNAVESYWIRARIIEVENQFSLYGQMLLPFLESLSLDFSFNERLRPVEQVYAENNCSRAFFNIYSEPSQIPLYKPLRDSTRAVYLAFDRPPDGYPICIYFKTEGQTNFKHQLNFEYYAQNAGREGKWKELKVNDRTVGLSEDGVISIFSPSDYKKGDFFASQGYFIRISDFKGNKEQIQKSFPVVESIRLNTTDIVQRKSVTDEMFQTNLFETDKVIRMRNHPVLSCECWVNEFSDISKTEQTQLLEKSPNKVKTAANSAGHISQFWVQWEKKEDFSASGADSRHYILDSYTGRITFGDGIKGRIPSSATQPNIRVNYSYGGGEKGNLPANSITGLVKSIPFVERVANPEMTCGGSNRHNIDTLERIGPYKLRHRNRAVTASDFENLVSEQFAEVKSVRCVNNYDRFCHQANGYVTVVVMPYDIENRRYALQLCRKIEQYLSGLVNCELLAGGRFSVVPAIVLKVDVTASIVVEDYEFAAQAEKNTLEALSRFLSPDSVSNIFKIGDIPDASNIFECLHHVEYVAGVNDILLEGRYYDGNMLRNVPIDSQFNLKYAVVANGNHTIRI